MGYARPLLLQLIIYNWLISLGSIIYLWKHATKLNNIAIEPVILQIRFFKASGETMVQF